MAASTIFVRPIARPGLRFALGHPARFIALGFGVGLIPFAPGTFGTLLALLLFGLLHPLLAPADFMILLGFLYLAGEWACDKAGRDLGVEDHKAIVWDEVVAFLLVLFFTPPTLLWQALAFLLFRLFDILKPGPIRPIEKMFRGGFGVMVDDLVAAFFALLCLALLKLLAPMAGGFLGPGIV
jgi:phosphatidylglycerophosphatase A